MFELNNFDWHIFIHEYWQKKPLLIKNAFVEFDDPLDEHDLAGLAQEPEIDARIVRCDSNNDWFIANGPFEEFDTVCQDKWTLLVQNVDRYLVEGDALMQAFNGLPDWRKDDLMVSFSAPGGSVGCHLDRYDVFICQGKGKRHWRVYPENNCTPVDSQCGLRRVTPHSQPLIDSILEAGDILYIPPNFPHHGIAVTECLNYSIGFRAPSQSQLLDAVSMTLENIRPENNQMYQDNDLSIDTDSHLVSEKQLKELKNLAMQAIDTSLFEQSIMAHLSHNHIDNELLDSVSSNVTEAEVASAIMLQQALVRTGGITPIQYSGDDGNIWYIQGEKFTFSEENSTPINTFLGQQLWTCDEQTTTLTDEFVQFVAYALNNGWWQFLDE